MIRNIRYRLDGNEPLRRLRRFVDVVIAGNGRGYRRILLVVFCLTCFLMYLGPSLLRWLFAGSEPHAIDSTSSCLGERLAPFLLAQSQFNAHIRRYDAAGKLTPASDKHQSRFVPYVGNGQFGLEIEADAHLWLKNGRHLSLPVNFHPIVTVSPSETVQQAATVTDYMNGLVHRFQCFADGYDVSYTYYAHRRMPQIFVQELRINNARNQLVDVELRAARMSDWPFASSQVVK